MSLHHWLSGLRRSARPAVSATAPRPRRGRLRVERLEGRAVPAVSVTGVDFHAVEGNSATVTVATFTSDDPHPQSEENYSATIDWGDGTTSVGTIEVVAGHDFRVVGTHTYADPMLTGAGVTVFDQVDETSEQAWITGTVAGGLIAAQGTSITAAPGVPFTGTVASFTTGNPLETAGDFTAAISWGDGETSSGTVLPLATGGFVVVASHTYQAAGPYDVTVDISDVDTDFAQVTGSAAVAGGFVATAVPFDVSEGSSFSAVVATFTYPSPASPAAFTATIHWGDGSTTRGTITANNSGGFDVAGEHVYAEGGNYAVKVMVNDGDGIVEATAVNEVRERSITSGTAPLYDATAGVPLTAVVATFRDGNPLATAATFTATVAWGDGSARSVGEVRANNSGGYDVVATHTYTTARDVAYNIFVSVTSAGGSHANFLGAGALVAAALPGPTPTPTVDPNATPTPTPTVDPNVTPTTTTTPTLSVSAMPVNVMEGNAYFGPIASFSDPNNASSVADFTATITWGDNTTDTGNVSLMGPGNYIVFASHTYARAGRFPIAVHVSRSTTGATGEATETAIVGDAPITAFGLPHPAAEGVAFEGVIGSLSDSNPLGSPTDFTVAIAWGDGDTSVGLVRAGVGALAIVGGHTYEMPGIYNITIDVTSAGGATAQAFSAVTVAPAVLTAAGAAIVPTAGAPFDGPVAGFTSTNPSAAAADFTAVISWGDGATTEGTVRANGQGGFEVVGGHTYAGPGLFAVQVTVTSDTGSIVQVNGGAMVQPVPLKAAGVAVKSAEGAAFDGPVATFTGGLPGAPAAAYMATIHWGDGTTSAGVVQAAPGGGFVVVGRHTYADGGRYAVTGVVSTRPAILDVGGLWPGAGASASFAATADVRAVAPTATFRGSTVAEGGAGTVAFAKPADPSAADTTAGFRYSYDFDNDGDWDVVNSRSPSAALPAALTADGSAVRVVRGRVADKDGLATEYTALVVVTNVAPTARFAGQTVAEGQRAQVTFAAPTDPAVADRPGLRYSYDFNNDGRWDVVDSRSPTAALPAALTADGNAVRVVRGRVVDKDGGVTEYVTRVIVTNVAPTARFAAGLASGSAVVAGFTGAADPSAADRAHLKYSFDFNNDGIWDVVGTSPAVQVPAAFLPTRAGTYTVRGQVRDKDGGASVYTMTYRVTDAALAALVAAGRKKTPALGTAAVNAALARLFDEQ